MRLIIAIMAIFLAFSVFAETVEVVTFEYPPLQGSSLVSELGVDSEIVQAAFKASGVATKITFIPTKRAITLVDTGEAIVMIGIMEYFSTESAAHLDHYPLLMINFDVYYLKSRFTDGFSFGTIDELKPYSIGVLMGGATDLYGKKVGLNVDGATSLDLVFKKLYARRNDLCIAIDLAGAIEIDRLFEGKQNEFGHFSKTHYLTLVASAIFNRNHPDYARLSAKFRDGLKRIIENGEWEAIVRRYYGTTKIPDETIDMMNSFAMKK